MENLYNGYTLEIPEGSFPLSTDSMILSEFAHLPRNASVLDLGSGCGTIGILLCSRDSSCSVTGIERDPVSHAGALANIRRNRLEGRVKSICADLRAIPAELKSGSFDCCVSNPPYFAGGPASKATPLARRNDCCSTKELFTAASRMLKFGGDFFLVQKPERLAEICGAAHDVNLEPKRLCLVRFRPDFPVNMILVSCRKGGKAGLSWEEVCLNGQDGQSSEYYRKLYHL